MAKHESSILTPAGVTLSAILWRVVDEFPAYEVSEFGHVRRVGGKTITPWVAAGYPTYYLYTSSQTRFARYAHRLVAAAFLPPRPADNYVIAHWDGSKNYCHYSNLRWATQAENAADAIRHGTVPRGERSPHTKLTEADAIAMTRAYQAGGVTMRELALLYPASRQSIGNIVKGRSWRHLRKALDVLRD